MRDNTARSFSLNDFPLEILLNIFSYLTSPKDLVSLSKTNKSLRRIIFDELLWEPFQKEQFQNPRITKLSKLSGNITKLVISPDGCVISSGKKGGYNCRIWNIATGECYKKLYGHKSKITALYISDDGRLISGDHGGVTRVWDIENWSYIQVFNTKPFWYMPPVTCFTTLPNGYVLSGYSNGSIIFWKSKLKEVRDISCLEKIKAPSRGLKVLAITALSNCYIANSYASTNQCIRYEQTYIWIWDLSSCRRLMPLRGHTDSINVLLALPDGLLASGSSDGTCRIWDFKTTKCLHVFTRCRDSNDSFTILTALPEGHLLAGGQQGTCYIWNLNTKELVFKFTLDIEINYATILSNGCLCVSGIDSNDCTRIITYPPGKVERFLQEEQECDRKKMHRCTAQ